MDDDGGAPVAVSPKSACRGELCCMADVYALLAARVLSASLMRAGRSRLNRDGEPRRWAGRAAARVQSKRAVQSF